MRILWRVGLLLALLGGWLVTAGGVVASAGGWDILGQHTVKPNETLYCIGRAYGVDPWAIATQNSVTHPHLLRPGTVLDIPNVAATIVPGPVCQRQFGEPSPEPPPTPAPVTCGGCTCRQTHWIMWGETLTGISMCYGVDIWAIAQCNCIANLNYIRAGASLCIP